MSDWEVVDNQDGQNQWEVVDDNPWWKQLESIAASGVHGANRGFSKVFGFGPHVQEAQQRYEQAKQHDPIAAEVGNVGAQIGSAIPFSLAGGMAARAIPGIGNVPRLGKYFQDILGGAIGGAGMGAVETPHGDETRLGNMASRAGELAAGEAIAPGIKYAAKEILKTPKRLWQADATNAADSIAKGLEKAKSASRAMYEEVFNAAGVPKVVPYAPSAKQLKDLKKLGGEGVDLTLSQYLQDHSPQNLKFFISEIDNTLRGIPRKQSIGDAAKNTTRQLLKAVKTDAQSQLEQALTSAGNPDLFKELKLADKFYKKEYVPYKGLEEKLKSYAADALGATDVTKAANKMPGFKHVFKDKHPGAAYAFSENPLVNAPGALPFAGSTYQYLAQKFLGK